MLCISWEAHSVIAPFSQTPPRCPPLIPPFIPPDLMNILFGDFYFSLHFLMHMLDLLISTPGSDAQHTKVTAIPPGASYPTMKTPWPLLDGCGFPQIAFG